MTGCVTVYQPLVGLQRPIAVDPQAPNNFSATRVLVRCHPAEGVEPDVLCRNLRSSLSKQGAQVTTEVVRPSGKVSSSAQSEAAPQFVIDVTSKLVHQKDEPLLQLLNIVSLTLVPAISETTYGQEFRIRDAQGFVLAQQSFQERFVQSFGLGVWVLNGLIDLLIRPKSEQVTGDGYKEEFTRDLHGHLAQLLHNAKVRARVMNSFVTEPPPERKEPPP
ncbi:MAG: hypothetical protein JNJ54_07470 [Myxococcaceae bacterium]|nr:hypothetical protein [Myxococcaceae bacterium]